MKLTDFPNHYVPDFSKPLFVKTKWGRAKVVDYYPDRPIGQYDKINRYWTVLINGPDGRFGCFYIDDAEIIN